MTEDPYTFYIAIGGVLIGFGALCLSLYNTYKQHHIRGPEFNLTEARVTKAEYDSDKTKIELKVLVQNIGDRMGLLRWNIIAIQFPTAKYTEDLTKRYKGLFEWSSQPNTQYLEALSIRTDKKLDSLKGGIFIATGVYSNHKGKLIESTWNVPLTGNLETQRKTGATEFNSTVR